MSDAVQEPEGGIDNTLAAAFAQVRAQMAESEAARREAEATTATQTAPAVEASPVAEASPVVEASPVAEEPPAVEAAQAADSGEPETLAIADAAQEIVPTPAPVAQAEEAGGPAMEPEGVEAAVPEPPVSEPEGQGAGSPDPADPGSESDT